MRRVERAHLEAELQRWVSKAAQFHRDARDADARVKALRVRLAGVAVGDIVLVDGEERIVRRVEPWSSGRAYLLVSKRKKDGEWSKATTGTATWEPAIKETTDD